VIAIVAAMLASPAPDTLVVQDVTLVDGAGAAPHAREHHDP